MKRQLLQSATTQGQAPTQASGVHSRRLVWATPLCAVMAVMTGANSARAITITNSASAPGTNVEISQAVVNDSSDLEWRNFGSEVHQYLGQTFTPTSNFTVDKISFFVRQADVSDRSDAGHTLRVSLFSAASESATSGSVLLSETGVTPAYGKTSNQWLTFDVSNTVSLTSGQIYGIAIDYDFQAIGPMAGGHKIGDDGLTGVLRVDNDVFSMGQAFRILNGVPQAISGDLAFVVQSGEIVPEPSSISLALCGVFGLVAARRRARRS
jgi:hypothetical protein